MGTGFTVERVHCCVCDGIGKVPRLLFWKRDCSVCEGTGKRRILIANNMSEADKWLVRSSAISGSPNYVPTGLFGVSNSVANRCF